MSLSTLSLGLVVFLESALIAAPRLAARLTIAIRFIDATLIRSAATGLAGTARGAQGIAARRARADAARSSAPEVGHA